jgi:hypothetical protein
MFKSNDKNYLYIILLYLVLSSSYLFSEYVITNHQLGVPLDDTWIHFRFAENFAQGYFFQYNIGVPTPGTSSPFWVIILSIPFLISKDFVLVFSLVIGSIFFLLTVIEIYRLCLKIGFNKNYSMLTAVLTLICGRLLWSSLSGMEIALFCYLLVLAVKTHLKEIETSKITIVNGFLFGLAVVTRPEAYILALIYYILTILFLIKPAGRLNENLVNFLISILIFLVIILPYPIFSYSRTGSLLPNTFQGQNAGLRYLPEITFVIESVKFFFRDNVLVLILWIISISYFIYTLFKKTVDKKLLLINLWVILLPVVSAFLTPNWRHHGRYLIPIIPFINIVSINILVLFYSKIKTKSLKSIKTAFTSLLVMASLVYTVIFAFTLGWNVENINNQQVNIAVWLNNNLPGEKILGTNDIGAITYLTQRKVIDMAGLVTPEVLRFQKMRLEDGNRSLLLLLKNSGVNYIIVYPDWYEYILKNYSQAFEKVYSARLTKNTICGGIEMFVYKIHWDKIDLK